MGKTCQKPGSGLSDSLGSVDKEKRTNEKVEIAMQVSADGMVATRTQTDRGHFNWDTEVREWPNATVLNGEIAHSVNQLKKQTGKDVLVYGGSGFVTSLIEHNLR